VAARGPAVPQRGVGRLTDEGREDERLTRYVTDLFAPEDAALAAIRARHARANLPDILISADEGKLLHVLLRAVGATRALEVGTLGGYSGVWLARALPPHGRLTTIERDPRHAAEAREAFALAGIADRVTLLEGAALDLLPTLEPGFDAVFLDADKEPLPQYFEWAVRLLRVGGLLLCDNAFFHGAAIDETDHSPPAEGVRTFNRLAASDPRVVATVVPVRDGVVVGVKVRE
jgi:predicted O-methyltransferase YrrM